jgi:hypothetical protein
VGVPFGLRRTGWVILWRSSIITCFELPLFLISSAKVPLRLEPDCLSPAPPPVFPPLAEVPEETVELPPDEPPTIEPPPLDPDPDPDPPLRLGS